MNTEYGWIKYVTKRAKNKSKSMVYTSKLTDHPAIEHSNVTPELALAACFVELSEKLRRA